MLNQSVGVRVVNEPTHRGTLKLYTDVQVDRSDDDLHYNRKMFRRLTLATYHCVDLKADHDSYVEEFKSLNPNFIDVGICYEFVIRKFG